MRVYRNSRAQKRGTVGLIRKTGLRCGVLSFAAFNDLLTSSLVYKALMRAWVPPDLGTVRHLGLGDPKIKPEVAGI